MPRATVKKLTTGLRFYQVVACYKVRGGKRSLWQARLREDSLNLWSIDGQPVHANCVKHITGAGNTADNAIRDLSQMLHNQFERLQEQPEKRDGFIIGYRRTKI